MAELLEEYFAESNEYLAISFKKNVEYEEGDTYDYIGAENVGGLILYLRNSKIDIKASTCGLHLEGKNKEPHIHFHAIIPISCISKENRNSTFISNPSKHRKDKSFFDTWSMKSEPLDAKQPKFKFLSYPFKEGRNISTAGSSCLATFSGKPMVKAMVDFLVSIGNTIYEEEKAKNLIRDKSEERKKQNYLELLELGENSGITFKNFRHLCEWYEVNWVEKMDREKPLDISNYKKNLQSISVKFKICKSYDFF